MDTLPDVFDIVVLGTGLPESIVAGAAAKAGKRVLHLDREDHYGAQWASLPLEEFVAWFSGDVSAHMCKGQPKLLRASQGSLGASKQYSIDLAPKVLFCSDDLIDAVLQAKAHNSLEFKMLQGSYVWSNGQLVTIPASRKDVFKTQLSLAEKRTLWRFLKNASDALSGQGPLKDAFDDAPLVELLKAQGLSRQLREALMYGIAMADADQEPAADARQSPPSHAQPGTERSESGAGIDSNQAALMSAAEGQAAFARFLASVARYGQGSGAFLALMYGCGELSQAFCRVAAVHGALTALRHPVAALRVDESMGCCTGVRLETGQVIACEGVVGNTDMLSACANEAASANSAPSSDADAAKVSSIPDRRQSGQQCSSGAAKEEPGSHSRTDFLDRTQTSDRAMGAGICRAVCILDGSLHSERSSLSIVVPPGSVPGPDSNPQAIRLLQAGAALSVAPLDRYVLYASTPWTGGDAEDALAPALSAFVTLPDSSACSPSAAAGDSSSNNHSEAAPAGHDAAREPEGSKTDTVTGSKPRALLAAFYTQRSDFSTSNLPPNVAVCQPPDASVGCAGVVRDARAAFEKVLPGLDMLDLNSQPEVHDDSDDEAIDALEHALSQLAQPSNSSEMHAQTETEK